MVLKRVLGRRTQTRMVAQNYSLQAGQRIYAIGDIHGRADLLDELLIKIKRDAEGCQHAISLVYLGDYVDRGFRSKQVIDTLLYEQPDSFEIITLLGNHEQWMLQFIDKPEHGAEWLSWGGDATLASYDIKVDMGALDEDALSAARDALLQTMPLEHVTFLENLQPCHRADDYLFVHAGIRPGIMMDMQKTRDFIWIRDAFLDSDEDHGMMVVHGHTPEPKPVMRPNRIGIDTGAFATNVLTALVLEGEDRRFIQTGL